MFELILGNNFTFFHKQFNKYLPTILENIKRISFLKALVILNYIHYTWIFVQTMQSKRLSSMVNGQLFRDKKIDFFIAKAYKTFS